VVQRLSRSFGFIERRRAMPCRTCFRARRQLKASLCNGRRSSGHWVCISLALPTVLLSLSRRGSTVSNESQRVLHKSLLSFSPFSVSLSLSFYRHCRRHHYHHHHHHHHHRRHRRHRVAQGDRAKLVQANSHESRWSTDAALCNDRIEYFKNRLTPEFLLNM